MSKAEERYYALLERCKQDEGVIQNYISELETEKAELVELLKNHMSFNCASFDDCYQTDRLCSFKNDCRFIKTANILNKFKGK